MATLGKAYVQIVPSAEGISGSVTELLGGETAAAGKEAGNSFAGNLVSVAKKVLMAAGIGKLLSASLSAGGDLQQSFGGIETLYGDAADAAKKYAKEAASAGISANTYAEQAVSFGASLKQAFGGDTAAAAEAANAAIMAMADNSAKFGTDISSVQAAYQGFAKQNYTMLDNLKLGYGGTRGEMERLLEDAQALTGVEYNIDNLGDVYAAIGAIQENLGVAGVAAQEAQTTFSGSFGAMQASAENLLASLSLGEGVNEAMAQLVESATTFLFGNLIPMVGNILIALPQALVTAITTGVPLVLQSLSDLGTQMVSALTSFDWKSAGNTVLTTINDGILAQIPGILDTMAGMIGNLSQTLQDSMPTFLEEGGEFILNMITGILDQLPSIIESMTGVLTSLIGLIADNLPEFLSKGADFLLQLIAGIGSKLPDILLSIGSMCVDLVATIGKALPDFLTKGGEIIAKIISGIGEAIPNILTKMGDMASDMMDKVTEVDWLSIGVDVVNGIISGINSIGSSIADTLVGLAKGAWTSLKEFFGINSPSRLMRDTIGRSIPEGIAVGITANEDSVTGAIDELSRLTAGSFDMGVSSTPSSGTTSASDGIIDELRSLRDAMLGMQLVLDTGSVVGGIAEDMDLALGTRTMRSRRGM